MSRKNEAASLFLHFGNNITHEMINLRPAYEYDTIPIS